jgi:hypothetical protein
MSRGQTRRQSWATPIKTISAPVALHFAPDNFVRLHQTIRRTPAMAAGVSRHLWSLEELVECTTS